MRFSGCHPERSEGSAFHPLRPPLLLRLLPRTSLFFCHPDRSGRFFPPLANASAGRAVEGSWRGLNTSKVAGNTAPPSRRSYRTKGGICFSPPPPPPPPPPPASPPLFPLSPPLLL